MELLLVQLFHNILITKTYNALHMLILPIGSLDTENMIAKIEGLESSLLTE
jgi:hypothetical protein